MPPTACTPPAQTPRIVFLTRDPVVHELSGSTTYILGLLELLRAQKATVTVVSTTAYSRSPRLFFRQRVALPEGVQFRALGYRRFAQGYVLLSCGKACSRLLVRAAVRWPVLRGISRLVQRLHGDALYAGAWDLTPPTSQERDAAAIVLQQTGATSVVANYCIWGPFLQDSRVAPRRSTILMHDLLSARVRRFQESGTPLDMPPLSEQEEMRWLSGANTVLAAQAAEAAAIRPGVRSQVLVTPIVLRPRSLPPLHVLHGRCLFVGTDIAPNQAALRFLLEEVWPRVCAAVPGASLAIAGTVSRRVSGAGPRSPAGNVIALGLVPSLEAEYARAAVCVVPLRFGTGIKIKLLEALGFGKAIVSTSTGTEGLGRWVEDAIAVADEAEDFAAAIVTLLCDDAARHARERSALRAAEQHFGPHRALGAEFLDALL